MIFCITVRLQTHVSGDEDGIAGHTDLPIRIEEEELITPESTPRWGVVMAAQEYLEGERKALNSDDLTGNAGSNG